MLDTLALVLDEYTVTSGADLQVQPPTVNAGSGELAAEHLLWRSGGREARGVKAFHNGERVAVSLKPRHEAPASQALCIVRFSVPKMATGSNYYPATPAATQTVLSDAGKYLQGIGIKTNIERATLARVDAAQTYTMREPFDGYAPVLRHLRGKRSSSREYEGMFLWGNKSWEICSYDKREEMRRLKESVAGLPANSLRMEVRGLTGKKVEAMFGLRTVAQLRDGLDVVSESYRAQLEAQLFRHELPEASSSSRADLVAQMMACKETDRFWFPRLAMLHFMAEFADDPGALKYAIRVASDNRDTANRLCRMVDQMTHEARALREVAPGKRTHGELYDELREKVLA